MTKSQTIVLDLDATMIHTYTTEESFKYLANLDIPRNPNIKSRVYILDFTEGDGVKKMMWGVTRPFTREFLLYCRDRFEKVIVWSAGTYVYVHSVCDILFGDVGYRPDLILTCDDCKGGPSTPAEKPLEWLYPRLEGSTPSNTIILDDSEEAISLNVKNAIKIPAFNPSITEGSNVIDIKKAVFSDSSEHLAQVMKWFELPHIKETDDLREHGKPFSN